MLSCIIIDDEPLARKGLKEYLAEADFIDLKGEFDNPVKSMDTISRDSIDLIFLDIQMPKITGLEFIKSLTRPPLIILTTAYPQYAVQGFELNVVDYLVKPFSFDRFWKALLKAKTLHEQGTENKQATENDYFYIKSDNKLVKINYADVLFVEALQNYVAIHTTAKKYITYLTLQGLEENLPANKFIKTHKSFIVAIDKVESIDGNEIKIGVHQIPISRTEREGVLEKLVQNKLFRR